MGVHSGSAVQRDGDWYGATVNVAARVADAAGAGEILLSLTTRERIARAGVTIADARRAQLQERHGPAGGVRRSGLSLDRLSRDHRRKGATGKRRPFLR